ncbi:MAG: DUF4906 domain-containing protein [Bacteroidales bacterium]|nr:DUF4906 domain-containing protein [Bacteroidales bacterium]
MKEVTPSPGTSGTGTLHISFDMGASTKAGAKDGDIIKKGSLWLVDSKDEEIMAFRTFSPNAASAVVTMESIQRGDYTLYVVANYSGLDTYTNGKIDDNFKKHLLKTVAAGESPTFTEGSGMPCSSVQQVHIAAGENYVSAHLQRCVGRLSINVRNNISSHKLAIGGIGLSDNNPTTGYLFPSSDGSIPPSATDVAFPELTQHVVLATNENKDVYDVYLYDTGEATSANGITFTLFGAIYEGKTPDENIAISSRDDYSFGDNSTSISAGGPYVIRSASSSTHYIGDLGASGLGVREFTGDADEELTHYHEIEYFLWTVSESSSQQGTFNFKNVKTGKYITLNEKTPGLSETSGTNFYFSNDTKNGGLLFSTKKQWNWNWPWGYDYGYSLTLYPKATNGLSGTTELHDDGRTGWLIRTATAGAVKVPYFIGSDYEIPRVKRTINYLDKYGNTQDLKSISRNEHVEVSINVFYNREWGQFDFEVEGWNTIDGNETTFD